MRLSGLKGITHIAIGISNFLFVGDWKSIQKVNTNGEFIENLPKRFQFRSEGGSHSVCMNGDLLFIEKKYVGVGIECTVYRMTSGNSTLVLKKQEDLQCIHSSLINNNILLGVTSKVNENVEAKVVRCDELGVLIQEIVTDDEGKTLYEDPHYITENRKNRNILISDYKKMALVVVDQYGQHRFDYIGRSPQPAFFPKGVCTDVHGNILLASVNEFNSAFWNISILDEDGHLNAVLHAEPLFNVYDCISLCLNRENNLIFVGINDRIMVFTHNYKALQLGHP